MKPAGILAALVIAAALGIGAASNTTPRKGMVQIYVATVLVEDSAGTMQLASFIDGETSEAATRAHAAEFIKAKFPGGRLVSMEIGQVSEEIIALACAARRKPTI